MTTEFIEIHWACGSLDEARKVSHYLVQERLVACSQILPWIESIYMWNNQLETAQESLVVLKTALSLYDRIREIIQQNTSYQVPQITYHLIDGGNEPYLTWLQESLVLEPTE